MSIHLIQTTSEHLQLNLRKYFNIYKHICEFEHTSTRTHMHIRKHTNSRYTLFLIYYAHLSTCSWLCAFQITLNLTLTLTIAAWCTWTKQTQTLIRTLTKNAQEITQIRKPISDSVFFYNNFSYKTHDHTDFKKPIKDSWLLNSHSLLFNPYHATRELMTSASTCSHVTSLYFVKVLNRNP